MRSTASDFMRSRLLSLSDTRIDSLLFAVVGLLATSLACGSGGSFGGGANPSPTITVTVFPASVQIAPSGIRTFTAQVTGATSTAVTWSVAAGNGTISDAGIFKAPVTTGVFPVRATLVADSSYYGEATVTVQTGSPSGGCSSADPGQGASLNGYLPFPTDNAWNQDISGAPVDPASGDIIRYIGEGKGLKADFGSGPWNGAPIGIPYVVVSGAQARVPINYQAFGDESDPGPMAIPLNAPVEGGAALDGDRHVLVLDRDNCVLYELYRSFQSGGGWNADSGTVWDLRTNDLRTWGWTSADAAGLPIFPGLARYDEVAGGEIKHALRFTVTKSRAAYTPPATHFASSESSASAPPMGMRVRLKAGVDITGFPQNVQVILKALKKYGMILADNGSSWYISGAPDERWVNDELQQLYSIKGSDLEVVQMGAVFTSDPTGPVPTITSFTADRSTVSAGQGVTLSWNVSNATRFFVNPEPGLVQGNSVTVHPAISKTYTLTAQGPFGSVTETVGITVNP